MPEKGGGNITTGEQKAHISLKAYKKIKQKSPRQHLFF